jgi:hypothetical protein
MHRARRLKHQIARRSPLPSGKSSEVSRVRPRSSASGATVAVHRAAGLDTIRSIMKGREWTALADTVPLASRDREARRTSKITVRRCAAASSVRAVG